MVKGEAYIQKLIDESYFSENPQEYYVYLLINPIDNKIFYVGKGKYRRAWEHLKMNDNNEKKTDTIKLIYSHNKKPIIKIVAEYLCENEAFNIELDLIWGINGLTNIKVPRVYRALPEVLETVELTNVEVWDTNENEIINEMKGGRRLFDLVFVKKNGQVISFDKQVLSIFKNLKFELMKL